MRAEESPIRPRSCLALVAAALLATGGCARPPRSNTPPAPAPEPPPFKIGVMTGTAAQGAEEFHAGAEIERRYPKRVMHVTFPDRFPAESVTVVAQLTGLASDPRVRVILVGQAVPGSAAAARAIRASRSDVLVGLVSPHEDPDSVTRACDLAIETDVVARAADIVAAARRMGARTLVHYSFARHMAQRPLARQRDAMRSACGKRDLRFVALAAPDPTESGGPAAARGFILADVPRQLDTLGATTAFYATDDAMQEPLIQAILAAGQGYLIEQARPSPTSGYPEALGLRIPDEKAESTAFVSAAIESLIAAKGMRGHFGTWAASADAVALRAMANLLVDATDGKAAVGDSATVLRYLEAEAHGRVTIRRDDRTGSHWFVTLERVTY